MLGPGALLLQLLQLLEMLLLLLLLMYMLVKLLHLLRVGVKGRHTVSSSYTRL